MENIYIVKRELGDELCDYLGYDEMHLDDKISLDMLFCKIVSALDNLRYENEDLRDRVYTLENPSEDFPYEQMVGK